MPAFTDEYTSGSQSKDPNTGEMKPDHESKYGQDDVRQLVLDAKHLLVGTPFDAHDPSKLPFKMLLDALNSVDSPITVVKGIHQRNSNPHIRFQIAADPINVSYDFHLDLTEMTPSRVYDNNVPFSPFVWKPYRLSVPVKLTADAKGRTMATHPVGALQRSMGRPRGDSITEGQIEKHIEGVNRCNQMKAQQQQQEDAEKERLRKAQEKLQSANLADLLNNGPALGAKKKK